MKYTTGDIWELAEQDEGWVVVPTNTTIKSNGRAVLGAGMAKQAAELYPNLPDELANHIRVFKDALFVHMPIICLATKHDWRMRSKLDLIEKGCIELARFGKTLQDVGHHNPIFLPKLGCGLGGLNWERVVRPVVDSVLSDDRFILVQKA